MAAGFGHRYGGLKQIEPVGPLGETILDDSAYDALAAGSRTSHTSYPPPCRLPAVPSRSIREAKRNGLGGL